MAGPTPKPFQKAFICAAVAFVVIAGAAVMTLGTPKDPAELSGQLFAYVAIPAVLIGFLARRSPKVWSTFKITAWFVVVLLIVLSAHLANTVKPPA
jgi:hypothetical protein